MKAQERFNARSAPVTNAAPQCHFTPMQYEAADHGYGGVDHWWECAHCGHKQDIGTETIGA